MNLRKSITINRPLQDVYRFWHDVENLTGFMSHLESVRATDPRHAHWKAKAPLGTTIEWDTEVTEDRPGRLIAWRSLPGADVDNAGTVAFTPAPGRRGTEVVVNLAYDPPGGAVATGLAKLLGEAPVQQVQKDLRELKQILETGEVLHSDASIHAGTHAARPDPVPAPH